MLGGSHSNPLSLGFGWESLLLIRSSPGEQGQRQKGGKGESGVVLSGQFDYEHG